MTDLAAHLAGLRAEVLGASEREGLRGMLAADTFRRLREACRREAEAWAGIETLADWERFRDERVGALRRSLGEFPPAPERLPLEVTGEMPGRGHKLLKLVYESRPGQPVAAHLYLPEAARGGMPGILICHSHHRPKEQAELQDMGVSWARSGAAVLIPDQPGHGERRNQPFGGRQDYYSRYYSGRQLHLAGQSLMGWMVWDLMRGVDVLLGRLGVDPARIILVGAVAGGGDPAAVTAALDGRVSSAAPFNFGKAVAWRRGMPASPGDGLNWADNGSWEETRNLRLSAREGFMRWLIVAACAPRPLIYAHEFEWEPEADPAWERLKRVYALYGAEDKLATVRGRGSVAGPGGSENTHCTNVGPIHRAQMYPAWERWFGFKVEEFRERREPGELACMTEAVRGRLRPRRIHELAADIGKEQTAAARRELEALPSGERMKWLREKWAALLGEVSPGATPGAELRGREELEGFAVERLLLAVEPGISAPALLLLPAGGGPFPAVVCAAGEGKGAFLRERAAEVAGLLAAGAAVCLPEVRGTGETSPDGERGREGQAITAAYEELMLGGTLLGSRLRDLRAALKWLRKRPDIDAARLALWGAGLSPANPPGLEAQPQAGDEIDQRDSRDWLAGLGPARPAEPLGALLALLGGLFEPEVRAVLAGGGLASFAAMLESHTAMVPGDCHVPGALAAGDLPLLAESLACPLRQAGQVDGLNRRVGEAGDQAAGWLLEALKG